VRLQPARKVAGNTWAVDGVLWCFSRRYISPLDNFWIASNPHSLRVCNSGGELVDGVMITQLPTDQRWTPQFLSPTTGGKFKNTGPRLLAGLATRTGTIVTGNTAARKVCRFYQCACVSQTATWYPRK
jgi:hypothetical protein